MTSRKMTQGVRGTGREIKVNTSGSKHESLTIDAAGNWIHTEFKKRKCISDDGEKPTSGTDESWYVNVVCSTSRVS